MALKVSWQPQPGPQVDLVQVPLPEVFYGGARGGGKTDGVLGKWGIKEERYGKDFNAIMFRRTTVSAEDAIRRAREIYEPLGAKFTSQPPTFAMPNGGVISFRYLETVDDAQEYQGRNVTDAWVEEAGQYPNSKPIDRLFGVLRSAAGIPIQLILTANPGGAGQHWIAHRYKLIPFPLKSFAIKRRLPNGESHMVAVIPSRIQDNKILMHGDPGYINRLYLVGSKELVRAWLEGDWSAIEGAFYDSWSNDMVIKPFYVPDYWTKFRSFDWGFAAPFSVGWWAILSDDVSHETRESKPIIMPRGSMVRYREWYGAKKDDQGYTIPNEGLRIEAEQIGDGILERQDENEHINYSVADPSAFSEDRGPSIMERISKRKRQLKNGKIMKCTGWQHADNKRVATLGHIGGHDQMRARMTGESGMPLIYCFDTCTDSIRTIPTLQHDPNKAEDLDTDGEDHAADEWRYACMSRPYTKKPPKPPEDIAATPTFNELIQQQTRRKRERI